MTRLLFLEACVAAFAARIALRVLPLRAVLRVVCVRVLPAGRASEAACRLAAEGAARLVAHPTCLYRALAAYALLARRYESVEFHLGAAVEAGLASHAWITVAGRAPDADAARYAPLWTGSPLGDR